MENKVILFTDLVFNKLKDQSFRIYDTYAKYVVYEETRIFNEKQNMIELVFSVALFDEPKTIQMSVILNVNNGMIYELKDDTLKNKHIVFTDGYPKYIVASHCIKKSKHNDDYKTDYCYYLLEKNKDIESSSLIRLNLNIADQLLISHVINKTIRENILEQNDVLRESSFKVTDDIVKLTYNPGYNFEILANHFFNFKGTRKNGVLSILFRIPGLEKYNELFLLTVNVSNNSTICKELKKKNRFKNRDEYINYICTDKFSNYKSIQFDNDAITIDYCKEDDYSPSSIPISRVFYYTEDRIFTMLSNERSNLFEEIIDTFI